MNTDHTTIEVRAELEALAKANHGLLNPLQVVEAARDEESILHPFFEWDDGSAAERYRLVQAHGLIRRVKLTIMRRGRGGDPTRLEVTTTRAFQSRPSQRSAGGGYDSLPALLADGEKRAELLAAVLRELVAYRKRYAELSELETVWVAVDEAISDFQPQASPASPTGDARPGAAG